MNYVISKSLNFLIDITATIATNTQYTGIMLSPFVITMYNTIIISDIKIRQI